MQRVSGVYYRYMETNFTTPFGKPLVLIIAVFIAGCVVGVFADPYLPASLSNAKKGYQSGFDAAKKLVLDNPVSGLFKTSDDVRSIRGVITAVEGNTVTFHLSLINPFDDQTLNDRVVTISASTKIVTLVQKDSKTIQAEIDAFNKTLLAKATSTAATAQPMAPPSSFTTTSASVGDLAIGSSVTVLASENIKSLKEFSASEIQIMPR